MTILDEILAHKAGELATRRRTTDLSTMHERVANAPRPRGFAAALEAHIAAGRAAVIAEIKKASPSKGVIRADFDPIAIAASYAAGGATCLSILTDERYFQGRDDYIAAVRNATVLPILRKDFVIDPYQVYETRALGADCVLLIVAALDDSRLRDCYDTARELDLDVLLEVHDLAELERALELSPHLIGINNRDLKTFETDLANTYALLPTIPRGALVVTESGIADRDDVAAMRAHGVHAFLVGEALMRAADPGAALRRLFG
jgi:indole-3-glycerol phosphate synthase